MASDDVPVVAAPRGSGERLAVDVLRFDAGHHRVLLGPHRHRDLELMYYARGGGRDRLGSRAHDVRDGDVLLVTPGLVHDASDLASAWGWAVEFSLDALGLAAPLAGTAGGGGGAGGGVPRLLWANPLLAPFLDADAHPAHARFRVPERDRPDWEGRFAAMDRELREGREGHREVVGAYLVVVLVEIARLAGELGAGLRDRGEPLLARVFEVIEERYAERLGTAEVAAAVGLTPGHLTTVVRRRTGRTVLDWVTERRMAEARRLLLTTDLPAEAVGRRVGYADPAYFNRRFRALHGAAPGTWRRRAGG